METIVIKIVNILEGLEEQGTVPTRAWNTGSSHGERRRATVRGSKEW